MSNVKFNPKKKTSSNSYRNILNKPKMKTITDIKDNHQINPTDREKPAFNPFALEREINTIHEHAHVELQ